MNSDITARVQAARAQWGVAPKKAPAAPKLDEARHILAGLKQPTRLDFIHWYNIAQDILGFEETARWVHANRISEAVDAGAWEWAAGKAWRLLEENGWLPAEELAIDRASPEEVAAARRVLGV